MHNTEHWMCDICGARMESNPSKLSVSIVSPDNLFEKIRVSATLGVHREGEGGGLYASADVCLSCVAKAILAKEG